MDNPDAVDQPDRTVAFVYELESLGIINVEERAPLEGMYDNFLARAADTSVPPGVFEMVAVRDTQGLLTSHDGIAALQWIENGVAYQIDGPAVSAADVLILAEGT